MSEQDYMEARRRIMQAYEIDMMGTDTLDGMQQAQRRRDEALAELERRR